MKKIIVPILCFILGGMIASGVLYYQIQNRYVIGKNAGYIEGASDVFHFLDKNIPEFKEGEYTKTPQYFNFKYFQIAVIEVNGIKTVKLVK